MINVLIADGHPAVCDGLRAILDTLDGVAVVGATGNTAKAVALADRLQPDVVLLDPRAPGPNAVTTIGAITKESRRSRVLVLAIYDRDPEVLPAIAAGAVGYLRKDATREQLGAAVRAAGRGEPLPAVTAPGPSTRVPRPCSAGLSQLEFDILARIAHGATARDVADWLFVSEATVRAHLRQIYRTVGVTDPTAAITEAIRRGI
jgi:DNA-binding NarL/FixJ family response regulator